MNSTSTANSTVAIVRSQNRRGAVAEALALIDHDIAPSTWPEVAVLADFTPAHQSWAWTHPDTLSATLDVVLSKGTRQVVVPVPDHRTLDRTRFRPETVGRAVRYSLESERNEPNLWSVVALELGDGPPIPVRVHRPEPFVSLASMKTAATSPVALGLGNLVNLVHPEDRVMLGLLQAGQSSLRGQPRRFWGMTSKRNEPRAATSLARSEHSGRLVAGLLPFARPFLSVVDGFRAIDHKGVAPGKRVALGVVVAGVDPVAVDAVAAAVIGFAPDDVAVLRSARDAGFGTIDLNSITLVGDSLASVQSRSVPRSGRKTFRQTKIVPAPHARPVGSTASSSR